jgi:hypothetical protein
VIVTNATFRMGIVFSSIQLICTSIQATAADLYVTAQRTHFLVRKCLPKGEGEGKLWPHGDCHTRQILNLLAQQ